MRQAIVTKYICPTNFKGSRVKATANAGSITLQWDDALSVDENHAKAAKALAVKYQWYGTRWVAGGLPNNTGNCYVVAMGVDVDSAAFVVTMKDCGLTLDDDGNEVKISA